MASVGGNLILVSLQDSSKYDSKNKSAGFGVTLCIPPYCAGSSSVSANASSGKMNSNFKNVTEQTGLWAGDGGFLIDIKDNTTLIGSVIASSAKAVADGPNKLTTGTEDDVPVLEQAVLAHLPAWIALMMSRCSRMRSNL